MTDFTYGSTLTVYRLALLLGAFVWPGWYFVVMTGMPSSQDSLLVRSVIGGVLFAIFCGSFASIFIRQYIDWLTTMAGVLVMAHLLYLGQVNDFQGVYLYGGVVCFFCISYIYVSFEGLLVVSLLSNIALLFLVVFDYNTEKFMLLAGYITISLFAVSNLRSKTRLLRSLRASDGRLRRLLEKVPLGIFYQEGRHTYVNEALQKILDLRNSNIGIADVERWCSSSARGGMGGEVEVESDVSKNVEWKKYTVENDKGIEKHIDLRKYVDGESILHVFADETQLNQIEQKMVQSSKMASLGFMAGGIAHEINNPLMVIQGLARLIFMDPTLNRQTKQHCEKIDATVKRIATIINGLLIFSRNRKVMTVRPHIAGEVVRKTLSLCQEKLKISGIAVEECGELDKECLADESAAMQCIVNVVANSVDALDGVVDPKINIAVEDRGEYVVVALSDNGPGIDPVVRDKIFDPFFTTKPIGLGTGLGLSISKGLMEAQQGSIDYVPTHAGCRFDLVFSKA